MVPNQLQQVVAEALDVPFPTVAFHARRLREAGFLTKGGRGKSAPAMKPSDAARLAFSIIASDTGLDSANVLHDFAAFAPLQSSCTGKMLELLGGRGINALAAVENLFRGLASGVLAETAAKLDPATNVERGLYVMVRLRGSVRAVSIGFQDSARVGQCVFVEAVSGAPKGFERVHRVYGHTLMAMCTGFRREA